MSMLLLVFDRGCIVIEILFFEVIGVFVFDLWGMFFWGFEGLNLNVSIE